MKQSKAVAIVGFVVLASLGGCSNRIAPQSIVGVWRGGIFQTDSEGLRRIKLSQDGGLSVTSPDYPRKFERRGKWALDGRSLKLEMTEFIFDDGLNVSYSFIAIYTVLKINSSKLELRDENSESETSNVRVWTREQL